MKQYSSNHFLEGELFDLILGHALVLSKEFFVDC
jgi:hypothetical protein